MIQHTEKRSARLCVGLVFALTATSTVAVAQVNATGEVVRTRFKTESVQGILAVQELDGWLLYDHQGQNPIANELVNPEGLQTRRWFYLIPAQGQPMALVHKAEADSFAQIPGRKILYSGHRDLQNGLRKLLKGRRRVAMEYWPKAAMPSLSRVDAGTIELVKAQGVSVTSSAELVQFTKSIWGPDGRISHYVAVHHLVELRKEVLAWLATQIRRNVSVTEYQLQQRFVSGYAVRGLIGEAPIVAAGPNSANPHYMASKQGSRIIQRGDVLLLDTWGRVEDARRSIYADMTWVAYVGSSVPAKYADRFEVIAQARDAALELIRSRIERRRPIRGFEADQQARSVLGQSGLAQNFVHRTGHSIDTRVHGDGANLDDYETHDTRNLVLGAGFSIEPGLYFPGEFGLRTEIDVYIGRNGVEVTTPVQKAIEPILVPEAAGR